MSLEKYGLGNRYAPGRDQGILDSNKYARAILGLDGTVTVVDVYRVLEAFDVIHPQLQHLAKKALDCGNRGHKDFETDVNDIIASAQNLKTAYEQKHSRKAQPCAFKQSPLMWSATKLKGDTDG
jgi:hypothetical protein